jgi:hypothetical protein
VRSGSIALLIVTWLRGVALAGPAPRETSPHDPDAAVQSPWLDDAPAPALRFDASAEDTPRDHRLASGLGLAGVYVGFSIWAYIAWYRNHPEKDHHDFGRDGWFGAHTYAGGADKLGHAWATMVLGRGGTAALRAGGWDRTKSAIASAVLADGLFFAVEMKDYYYYEFSPGDMTFNTLGALSGLALDLFPRLDEFLDYRVEYWPSKQYIANLDPDSPCAKRVPGEPSCSRWNIAEDYSGETYLLALHLGAFHGLRDWKYGTWSRFFDAVVGFQSRNYKPPPRGEEPYDVVRSQTLFLGASLNIQGVFDYFLDRPSRVRKVGHGVFEVIQPFGAVPFIGVKRNTTNVATGGA